MTTQIDPQWQASDVKTLRDALAASAPKPPEWWDAQYRPSYKSLKEEAEHLAAWAYAYADAMMAERAK